MTQAELHTALKTLGLPVAYGEFKSTDKSPAPSPPFITYQFAYSNDFKADNQNYLEISNFQVEFYSKNKDLINEGNIQALLSAIRTAVIFFYLSNEGISILENADKIGLPIPERLKNVLGQINMEDKK